jgi:hypothetical protein
VTLISAGDHMRISHDCIKHTVSLGHSIHDSNKRWVKMNFNIVHESHNAIHTRGWKGHVRRQSYRHRAWKVIQRDYPEFRMYKIPYSIRGNSKSAIKLKYKIINYLKSVFSAI